MLNRSSSCLWDVLAQGESVKGHTGGVPHPRSTPDPVALLGSADPFSSRALHGHSQHRLHLSCHDCAEHTNLGVLIPGRWGVSRVTSHAQSLR